MYSNGSVVGFISSALQVWTTIPKPTRHLGSGIKIVSEGRHERNVTLRWREVLPRPCALTSHILDRNH